jgi:hypothetical protein
MPNMLRHIEVHGRLPARTHHWLHVDVEQVSEIIEH